MLFNRSHVRIGLAALAIVGCGGPALAEAPLSIQIGPQFALQESGRNAGGAVQGNVGLNYDFGPRTIVPIRASFQFDDANGTHGGAGNIHQTGFGFAARLTTPLYAGVGVSVYNTSARLDDPAFPQLSATGIGTNYFVGDRVLSLPGGVSFSLQATYKQIPQFDGINPSAVGLGLRVQL